jgi:hypothetical protein
MTISTTVPGGLPELLAAEPAVLTGARIGYARVSTNGQLLDRQLHALNEVGCIKVFADKQSGRDADRPDLIACLAYLRAGDTLVVPSLDRLARSLQDLVTVVSDLRRRGFGFRSLHEAIDTTTPGGRLVFHLFAALAEFIRELIGRRHPRGTGRGQGPRRQTRSTAGDDTRAGPLGAHVAGPAGALGDLDRQAARRQPVHDL